MYSYSCCKQDEEKSERPMIRDKYGTIQKGYPYKADGYDLDSQRYGSVDHEIGDVRAELRMVQKPVIQSPVATEKESRSQKQQRSCRQDRKKNPQYSQT